MRANVPEFELRTPRDLRDVLETLSRAPAEWRPLAGGTDLMVQFEAGAISHRKFINLWGLPELRGTTASKDYFNLGALETYTDLLANAELLREFPLMGCAARETGALAIQNRGTLGGNIANASPAADTPPALLTYDAEVSLLSSRGQRWVKYSEFHQGYKLTASRPDELIDRVRLPRVRHLDIGHRWHFYRKVGTRRAQAISKVCLAGLVEFEGPSPEKVRKVRLALGSVGPVPLRVPEVEEVLRGRLLDGRAVADAQAALAAAIAPIDDVRSTAEYRKLVAGRVLAEFLGREPSLHRVSERGVSDVELGR